MQNKEIVYCKEVGKVRFLKQEVEKLKFDMPAAIAQTRWATHGKVTKVNAHPHFDAEKSLAVVHNGIIENHDILRKATASERGSFSFRY